MIRPFAMAITLVVTSTAGEAAPHTRFNQATIAADRPGAAVGSNTVGRIVVQLETSYGLHIDGIDGAPTTIHAFPSLLRVGVLRWLELRVEGEIVAIARRPGAAGVEVGATDLTFGLKLHWLDNRGVIPSLGLLVQLLAPTGAASFSAGGVEPMAKVLFDWTLPARFSLAFNMGLDSPVRDGAGHKFVRYLSVVNVGYTLPIFSERLGVFVETETRFPLRRGKKAQISLDTGLWLRVLDNLQIDLQAIFGLTAASEDVQLGFGISWRI